MIEIDSYLKEGIVFSLSGFDYSNLKHGPYLFEDVTDIAQEFYVDVVAKEDAIYAQLADLVKGVDKSFDFYLKNERENALNHKIYIVLDKDATLFDFWREIQRLSFDFSSELFGEMKMPIQPMFVWYKGVQVDFEAIDAIAAPEPYNN